MATSAYFSVFLPGDITEEQLVKIYEWGKNCLHCNVIQQDDGYSVIAHRHDEKDLRARQRLMLTNLKNWGIDTGKQKGWLKVLTKDEYNALNEHRRDARNSLPNQCCDDDSDCMAETKPALPRCSAKVTLPLPPNLLTDPAFLIAAR